MPDALLCLRLLLSTSLAFAWFDAEFRNIQSGLDTCFFNVEDSFLKKAEGSESGLCPVSWNPAGTADGERNGWRFAVEKFM